MILRSNICFFIKMNIKNLSHFIAEVYYSQRLMAHSMENGNRQLWLWQFPTRAILLIRCITEEKDRGKKV